MSGKHWTPPAKQSDTFPGIEFLDVSPDPRWTHIRLQDRLGKLRPRWRGKNLRRLSDKALFSAQLRAGEFDLLKREDVRRVIALRLDPVPALRAQIAYCQANDIEMLIAGWSSKRAPQQDRFERLIRTLQRVDDLDGTTLFHCSIGADRTGLAAACYRLLAQNATPEEALSEFSFRRGHVAWGTDGIQSEVIRAFARSGEADFKTWVFSGYDPEKIERQR